MDAGKREGWRTSRGSMQEIAPRATPAHSPQPAATARGRATATTKGREEGESGKRGRARTHPPCSHLSSPAPPPRSRDIRPRYPDPDIPTTDTHPRYPPAHPPTLPTSLRPRSTTDPTDPPLLQRYPPEIPRRYPYSQVSTRPTHLAHVVAPQVHKHDVLSALLLVRQQLRLQGGVLLRRRPPPPRARQRPAQSARGHEVLWPRPWKILWSQPLAAYPNSSCLAARPPLPSSNAYPSLDTQAPLTICSSKGPHLPGPPPVRPPALPVRRLVTSPFKKYLPPAARPPRPPALLLASAPHPAVPTGELSIPSACVQIPSCPPARPPARPPVGHQAVLAHATEDLRGRGHHYAAAGLEGGGAAGSACMIMRDAQQL